MADRLWVKVCGITNIEDAVATAEAGADAIGFNFAEGPRLITPATAAEIRREVGGSLETIALFVNADAETIRRTCETVGCRTVQLHGDEPPTLVERLADLRVIKALRVAGADDLGPVGAYDVWAYLIDARSAVARGGTGETTDWDLAAQVAARERTILAGGLHGENVAEAVRTVRPFGVDASSLIESAPGKKAAAEVARYVAAARSA